MVRNILFCSPLLWRDDFFHSCRSFPSTQRSSLHDLDHAFVAWRFLWWVGQRKGILNWSKGCCTSIHGGDIFFTALHGIIFANMSMFIVNMIYNLHKDELIRVVSHRNPLKGIQNLCVSYPAFGTDLGCC